MTALEFHGARLLLDPAGGMFWPAERLLAVADLHLEKGSATALPPWDTRTTLDRVEAMVRRHRPRVLVAVGDSFHDPGGARRMQAHDARRLALLARGVEMVWVSGNHDPDPPAGLPGVPVAAWRCGGLVFRHIAAEENGEISGHYHPKARVDTGRAVVTRPCFVAGGGRLLLPAVGAYTGGLDVRDPAIARLFPGGGRVFLLGRDRVFSFALPARSGAAQRRGSAHIERPTTAKAVPPPCPTSRCPTSQ